MFVSSTLACVIRGINSSQDISKWSEEGTLQFKKCITSHEIVHWVFQLLLKEDWDRQESAAIKEFHLILNRGFEFLVHLRFLVGSAGI